MSSPPPTKPPRGVKQGKETSGLLMSVIRTLSASETNEQREKERAKLEKEYKKSDARLDELVAANAQEIMDVMQKFSAVGGALTVWDQHCEAVTARLAACRGLLRLRRDDLKRLWMTSRTHHYALQMLTDIERVVVSEREAREYIAAGRVLACAHTLTDALATADTTLSHVDALNATRHHLEAKKRALVDTIVKLTQDAVYRLERAPLTRSVSARRRTALLLAELTKSEEVTDAYLQDITPEFEASLTEEDKTFETTVMISLEALGVLDQLKEATEKFKVQIQNELLEVIDSVSRRVIEEGDIEPDPECEEDGEMPDDEGVTESGRPLARLVTILGEEFRACAARNKRLLQLWRAALQKHKISDSCLHTEQHYWSAVQQVLQLLLTEYLEIALVTSAGGRSETVAAPFNDSLRLVDYFGKKRPQRRRTELFKLAASPAGSGARAARRPARAAVCRPSPAHLHAVLPALHRLCADIERTLPGSECSLRAFITDYVRSGESERLARTARDAINQAMAAPSAWRERADVDGDGGSRKRIIFSTCVEAWSAVRCACARARRCGRCGGAGALRGALGALAALGAHARRAHARLAPHHARAHRWLADDDILRFLQSLPNWKAAVGDSADKPGAQELKQAYEREAEILGSSLGDGAVTQKEIIADVNTLVDLAVLCESMEWLAANTRGIPALVAGAVRVSDKFVGELSSAAQLFQDIAHKCLLLLHLEIRIECFHYLGQEERAAGPGPAAGEDLDAGGAGRLAHAALTFHEQAAAVLAPHRLAYILEGVGEMMSAAVVWRWRGARGGSAGAGARLATLRHCLAALHLPHDGLHRAHAYLHLLTCSPEEIISMVREKGAQFSELEYLNAFKVIGTKRALSAADMKQLLKQLSAALGHVGVTV